MANAKLFSFFGVIFVLMGTSSLLLIIAEARLLKEVAFNDDEGGSKQFLPPFGTPAVPGFPLPPFPRFPPFPGFPLSPFPGFSLPPLPGVPGVPFSPIGKFPLPPPFAIPILPPNPPPTQD